MFIIKDSQVVSVLKCADAAALAGREFARYLNQIAGADPADRSADAPPTVEIQVDGSLPPQAFRIRCDGAALSLAGQTRLEALHAVYWLLEEYAGCFWAAPGVDDIPRRTALEIPAMDVIKQPATPIRGMQLHRYDWMRAEDDDLPVIDWLTKRRMNFALLSFFEVDAHKKTITIQALKERGIEFMFGLHTFNYWLPPEKYFAAQPELYAWRGGRRVNPAQTAGAQICMTNPAAAELSAENIIRYLEANPGMDVIGLGANDGPAGWCECPACEAFEPLRFSPLQPRIYAGRVKSLTYAAFCNRVVEQVARRFPNQRFAALFYTNTLPPPADPQFRLHPNIDAVLALFERYYDRPLAAGVRAEDYRSMPPHKMLEERYTQYPAILRRWREIAPGRVYFHAYFMGTNGTMNLPFPFYNTIAEDFRLCRSLGLDGFYTQAGVPDFGTYGLNFYLAAESSYDTELPADAVMAAYCRRFYGPAAEPMQAYYRALQAKACARHTSNASELLLEIFDRDTPRLQALLEQAGAAAQPAGPVYAGRVAQAAATLRYAMLCKQYRLGWLKIRGCLQQKNMAAAQAGYQRLEQVERQILALAQAAMLGRGLLHYRDAAAVERYVLGNLRRGACTEKMAGNIDYDIPWDVE